MERALKLLEITYANAVAHEIEILRREICCGCKVYEQDCLMKTEQEGWDMLGLTAMERVSSHHMVWHEFLNVLEILNMEVHKEFADHLTTSYPGSFFGEGKTLVGAGHVPPRFWVVN